MTKVDLVTGFLGAGKTTFIIGYLKYLQSQGLSVRIIENEFGPVSVDTDFLKHENEHCSVTDLTGLCMCCTGRNEFIYQLTEAAHKGVDRVIVEPSGIYDVDEFFEVMDTVELGTVCEIGSVITVVDSGVVIYPTEEARYLSFCQLLSAGCIVLSKTQCGKNSAESAVESIRSLMADFECPEGPAATVFDKNWELFTESDYKIMINAGCNRFIHDRMMFSHSETFQSYAVAVRCNSRSEIEGKIRRLFRAAICGKVFRVKGYVRNINGGCFEVNCTGSNYSIVESKERKKLLVVIGQHLNETAVEKLLGGNNDTTIR